MTDLLEILGTSSSGTENRVELKKGISKPGRYILAATGGTAVAITLITVPFLAPGFRKVCLPYVPATHRQMVNVFSALRGRSGTLVDLGSGDGRIVRAAGNMGFQAVGVELNISLVLYSRYLALLHGPWKNTKFYKRNLWSFNLKPYSNVVVFGTEDMMCKVEKKCIEELNENSCIVACRFPLPNLKPNQTVGEGIDTVWRYDVNSSR